MRPQIGMRVKLAARGGGRWQGSGGYRSKFGLTVGEILHGLEELKQRGMADCFKLLHFHLGSQITNIRHVKDALNEAARIYAELHKARRRAGIPRRRRRPGRRLRRLADQLRVERELHAPGIRQRRRLPHPERVRRGGRAASDDHLRKRPGRGGLSLGARSSACWASPASAATAGPSCPIPTRSSSRCIDLIDTFNNLDDAQRARELSRRPAGAGHGA